MENIKLIGYIALVVGFVSIFLGLITRSIATKQQKNLNPVRQKTMLFLRKLKVPFNNPSLPMYADNNSVIKTKDQIARRALTLSICLNYGKHCLSSELSESEKETIRKQHLKKLMENNLEKELTPNEKILFTKPTQQLLINLSWQSERIPHLAFALGLVDFPPFPEEQLDWWPLVDVLYNKSREKLLEDSKKPLTKDQILSFIDLFYCLDWACKKQLEKGKKVKFANAEVVNEQFKTYVWLTSNNDEWDNIQA